MPAANRSTIRIWLLILATLFIVSAVFFIALAFLRPPAAVTAGDLHANWQQHVAASIGPLLSSQPTSDQIAHAENTLLYLKIAPQDRDADLALVMALLSVKRDEPGAMDRLRAAYALSQQ